MIRIKLERFPDGDDEDHIAYGYDPDGRPLFLQLRRFDMAPNDCYENYIWIEIHGT